MVRKRLVRKYGNHSFQMENLKDVPDIRWCLSQWQFYFYNCSVKYQYRKRTYFGGKNLEILFLRDGSCRI